MDTETAERIDRRLAALEQLYPGTNRVFADRDGTWSLPSLRGEIKSALQSRPSGEVREAALCEALIDARRAIAELDEYTLGGVTMQDGHGGLFQYPIRDELLSKIDLALVEPQEKGAE